MQRDRNRNRRTFDESGSPRYSPRVNKTKAPDLTKQFPRSPHDDLGGYVLLPRILDKCRALLAGTIGEYKYNCPLDRQWFDFAGVDADELKAEVAKGKSDDELVEWVRKKADPHTESETNCWNYEQRTRAPLLAEQKAYFESYRRKFAPKVPRAYTWFDLLDAEEGRIK